jgi:hypothetical protein
MTRQTHVTTSYQPPNTRASDHLESQRASLSSPLSLAHGNKRRKSFDELNSDNEPDGDEVAKLMRSDPEDKTYIPELASQASGAAHPVNVGEAENETSGRSFAAKEKKAIYIPSSSACSLVKSLGHKSMKQNRVRYLQTSISQFVNRNNKKPNENA